MDCLVLPQRGEEIKMKERESVCALISDIHHVEEEGKERHIKRE